MICCYYFGLYLKCKAQNLHERGGRMSQIFFLLPENKKYTKIIEGVLNFFSSHTDIVHWHYVPMLWSLFSTCYRDRCQTRALHHIEIWMRAIHTMYLMGCAFVTHISQFVGTHIAHTVCLWASHSVSHRVWILFMCSVICIFHSSFLSLSLSLPISLYIMCISIRWCVRRIWVAIVSIHESFY